MWRYQGTRGVVWRIRYQDATGRRILETLGKEPAWNRQLAERELRRRLVDVERDGYQKPRKQTFAAFAERWLDDYLPGRNLKLTTTDNYRQTLRNHLLPAFGTLTLERLEHEPELLDPARLARVYLKHALHTAGISKPFRPYHDLRHTALTHDAAAGNPLTYIQHKAGHSQTQITERYIHAAQTQFAGAAERAERRMYEVRSDGE
ncbi:MAG TPA: tyrosine-type recombinase/integrase [Gaiellaceae bacterium]|nr:tyrosine-type recombinase/integrase [Gaiellaceae bacterium]